MKNLCFFFFYVFISLPYFYGIEAKAQDSKEDVLSSALGLDMHLLTVTRNFFGAVVQKDVWSDPKGNPYSVAQIDLKYSGINPKTFPHMLKEFSFRENGMPKYGVLQKWPEHKVVVTFGWPVKFSPSWEKVIEQTRSKYEVEFAEPIKESVEEFNKLGTDVSFEYTTPLDFDSLNREDALYIVPFDGVKGQSRVGAREYRDRNNLLFFEAYLRGGGRFSPRKDFQVEGYFVPDNLNNIKFAVCYVNVNNQDDYARSLIKECLVRSLGIPNTLSDYDGILKERTAQEVTDFSQNDADIINLLYSSAVKSGDDLYNAASKLNLY